MVRFIKGYSSCDFDILIKAESYSVTENVQNIQHDWKRDQVNTLLFEEINLNFALFYNLMLDYHLTWQKRWNSHDGLWDLITYGDGKKAKWNCARHDGGIWLFVSSAF